MNTNTPAPEQVYGYDVLDSNGDKIGDVDGVWVDDATSQLEFVGVKTGWLMGKTHLIPAENAQFGDNNIQVPYGKDQIKDAPSFGTDAELSPDDENNIYSYYGMDRSTAPSPTGLGAGQGTSTGTTGTDYNTTANTGTNVDSTGSQEMTLSEEELEVGKRQVQTGAVRLRKVVRTEHVTEPIELRREEVEIERVDASGTDVPSDAFQERQIEVPVMQEEPVVAKEAHVTGRVQVNKDVETETRNVDGDVRREDVEVDDNSGTGNFARNQTTTDSGYTAADGGYTTTDTTDTNTGGGIGDRLRSGVDDAKNKL